MKKVKWFILVAFAATALSCAHPGSAPNPDSLSFSIKIAEGWRKIDSNQYFLVTKDNPFKQYVMVQNRPIYRSFKHTRKK